MNEDDRWMIQKTMIRKVPLPVKRRVMPTVIANNVVGVSPMAPPVKSIHTMRFEDYSDLEMEEVLYRLIFGGTGHYYQVWLFNEVIDNDMMVNRDVSIGNV